MQRWGWAPTGGVVLPYVGRKAVSCPAACLA